MMDFLTSPEGWIALLTLTAIEIVLGVDNLIFIAIMAGKLPEAQRAKARSIGLFGALFTRIALLFSLTWIMQLTAPLFTVLAQEISGRDVILLAGGLFLLMKSVLELHHMVDADPAATGVEAIKSKAVSFAGVVVQIAILDIVFSLDSIITAVGLTDKLPIMVTAIVIAIAAMMLFAGAISDFIDRNPTLKVLALAFLLMIGTALIAEGLDFHIPKAYLYFAMAFSVGVEVLNIRVRRGK